MTPEQQAAYINAQAALFLIELEALKASTEHLLDPVARAKAFKELYDYAGSVLGANAVINFFGGRW